MKELSIEEKAKAYDEAIERIENIKTGKCETTFMFTNGLLEYIFPELKESEDENIRKYIISFIKMNSSVNLPPDDAKRMLAWLEKQGEQKPAEWSDEDYVMQRAALEILMASPKLVASTILKESVIVWLKSLKDRYTWKPSEEQIIALRWVLNNVPYNKHKEEISGLIEQIKDFV